MADPREHGPTFPRHHDSDASIDELLAAAIARLTSLGLPNIEMVELTGWRRSRAGWFLCRTPAGPGRAALLPDGTLVVAGRKVPARALDPATREQVASALQYVILWGRPPRDAAPS